MTHHNFRPFQKVKFAVNMMEFSSLGEIAAFSIK